MVTADDANTVSQEAYDLAQKVVSSPEDLDAKLKLLMER